MLEDTSYNPYGDNSCTILLEGYRGRRYNEKTLMITTTAIMKLLNCLIGVRGVRHNSATEEQQQQQQCGRQFSSPGKVSKLSQETHTPCNIFIPTTASSISRGPPVSQVPSLALCTCNSRLQQQEWALCRVNTGHREFTEPV